MAGGLRIWFRVMGIVLWGMGRVFLRRLCSGICRGRSEDWRFMLGVEGVCVW